MRKTCFKLGAAMVLACATSAAHAAPVQWTVASGGNGHWYEVITTTFATFDEASAYATSQTLDGSTGYLATITSAAEQAFLNTLNVSGVTSWLGGSDAEQEGVWKWVTAPEGETPIVYTNWAPGEPNNAGNDPTGGEDHIVGWWGANGAWNDMWGGYSRYGAVVEYTPISNVPVPAAGLLLMGGLGGLAALRRKRVA